LLVSSDSEFRKRERCRIMRTSELGHEPSGNLKQAAT
jgi:hypothetical protein